MSTLVYNFYPLFLFLSFSFFSYSPHAHPTDSINPSSIHIANHSELENSRAFSRQQLKRSSPRQCQPFYTTFSDPSAVADRDSDSSNAPFIALSPPETYAFTSNGLEMYLHKPKGELHSANGMNDNLGEASTINSTFWIPVEGNASRAHFDYQYWLCLSRLAKQFRSNRDSAKVTYEVSCDYVPGVICAFILIDSVQASNDEMHLDEIDVELVGSGSARWQTNIFKPSKADPDPHYGHFDTKEQYSQNPSYASFHKYSISWDSEKIVWGLDGQAMRTMRKEDTYINGVSHFPGETDPLRLQLGIWDGSGAEGTSSWAGGPVNWDTAPQRIVATVRSVSVEC
ncbi:concanavalin A-like lectin/glucanase [Lentinula aciculospora]|uniref:Concanavalin A-like lectin/glucanase n=1 Tax=Lentinula aciculospora TaxID=153920 RepID=A0A9W9A0Y0_9AGAR|nr:concanavalin A-like lectin/glucanase [Lentinula aciculospora]